MRSVPPLLPTALVLALLGAWAGTSLGQLPPPPTVSVPTVSVSIPTVTVPPVPPVTTPTVTAPRPPVEPPVPVPAPVPEPAPAPPAPPPPPPPVTPAARHYGASSRLVREGPTGTAEPTRVQRAPAAERSPRAAPRKAPPATLAATNRPYEDEAVDDGVEFGLGTIRAAADAVPPALLAIAALAVLLLGVASMPQAAPTSRAGAALVHHRGVIALAGIGVLIAAVLSFTLT
jgi:hypothetical protein